MPLRPAALALAILAAAPVASPAAAQDEGVLLTVTDAAGEVVARYDREDLAALGEVTFATSTIWTDGVIEFTGVPLAALVADLGVTEGVLTARAINDYAVEIPVADAVEGGPIVATLADGEPMPVRDKGPLWIVWPFDADPAWRTEEVYARSIWQLDRLEIGG